MIGVFLPVLLAQIVAPRNHKGNWIKFIFTEAHENDGPELTVVEPV